MVLDRVFYINLDHRTDRRTEIESELETMALSSISERFPAIRHETIGGVGCGRSHIEVLKLAKERGYSQILVLEDDFMLTVDQETLEENLAQITDLNFDVCLLSYNLQNSRESGYPFMKRVLEAQTTSGYIVKSHYYDALIQVFSDAVVGFEQTNYHWIYAIDVAWKVLQARDTWYCFNPRLGKQRPSYSDCGNCVNDSDW
jgi:glycosyl transferase family 25